MMSAEILFYSLLQYILLYFVAYYNVLKNMLFIHSVYSRSRQFHHLAKQIHSGHVYYCSSSYYNRYY